MAEQMNLNVTPDEFKCHKGETDESSTTNKSNQPPILIKVKTEQSWCDQGHYEFRHVNSYVPVQIQARILLTCIALC